MRYRLLLVAGAALLIGAGPVQSIAPGYQPLDKDERGLWMQMDEAERDYKTSHFVMRDPALNTYVRDVLCRTIGESECRDIRLYVVRTPVFNAAMAPNGVMIVYSGLFLRTRDEAQLAAVLAHEFVHYRNRHSLRNFRSVKDKANILAVLSVVPVASVGAAGIMSAVQLGLLGSIFSFSREMEREADTVSVPLLAAAGYDPMAASRIWEQIRAEQDATAAARKQVSRKDRGGGMYATHPSTAERMSELKSLAEKEKPVGTPLLNRDAYRNALAPYWPQFVDDQIKLNDFGGTEFLIQHLAGQGWTAELHYARGELYRQRGNADDLKQATDFYRQAIAAQGAPAEAWRGLGLSLLRTGNQVEGRQALKEFLARKPDATDRAMIAMLIGERK